MKIPAIITAAMIAAAPVAAALAPTGVVVFSHAASPPTIPAPATAPAACRPWAECRGRTRAGITCRRTSSR